MKACKRKDGYVLLLCLIFITLLAMGSTMLIYTAKQKVFSTKKNIAHLKAQIIAEAGIYKSVAAIMNDASLLTQTCPDVQTATGAATISIKSASADELSLSSTGSNGSSDYLLTSTSTFKGETASAAVVINYTGPSGTTEDPKVVQLFDGALFCGGNADMSGGGNTDLAGATAHINGTLSMKGSVEFQNGGSVSSSTMIDMSGGNATINGDAMAPTISLPSWTQWGGVENFVTGTITETAVPKQMIEIDLEPYRLYAASTDTTGQNYSHSKWNDLVTDTYISADEMSNSGTLNIGAKQIVRPAGGVLWVEGNIKFDGSSIIEGCVIATGDIDVLGGMTHKNANGLPAFMSVNGNVLVGSGCQVYGLVYAHNGSIKIQGNANVTGAFICPRGDFTDCGSGSVVYDNSRPYGPNGETVMLPQNSAGGGTPTVVGWLK